MGELLLMYACFTLAAGSSEALPVGWFRMPLQDYWLFWKIIGFGGLLIFQSRWVVQWLYSEKHKESRMPISFWWLSLAGAMLELCYFLRQQDSVGIAGYIISVVPYTRNLMLIYDKRARDREALAATTKL